MKYLVIENGKGHFINATSEKKEIDSITKEDIMFLLDEATNEEKSFEMDSNAENLIQHEAHKIIYQNIYDKFQELLLNKTRFIDESRNMYKEELERYCGQKY